MASQKAFSLLEKGIKQIKKAKCKFKKPDGTHVCYAPFFSSINASDCTEYFFRFANGGLGNTGKNPDRKIIGRVKVCIGDYNSGGGSGSKEFSLPLDLNKVSSSQNIWDASNDAFWLAIADYDWRNMLAVGIRRERREKYRFLSREPKVIFQGREREINGGVEEIAENLRQVSSRLFSKELWNFEAIFRASRHNRYLVNSEGTRFFESYLRYSIGLFPSALDPKGRIINYSKIFYSFDLAKLPNLQKLLEVGERIKSELSDIVSSPLQENGKFPVIMDPVNHGVLWHEAIGHGLEAQGMKEAEINDDPLDPSLKVCLFLGKLGHKVAPEFINVYDDPTRTDLDGCYKYDDEGVKARRVTLIKNGVLRRYLHSRASAGFFRTHSNGHARAEAGKEPESRMGNIIVESSNPVSFGKLKEELVKECERQNAEYGLLFSGVEGGLCMPDRSVFETFPSRVFRVHRNGKLQQVRGIYIIGTPYQAIGNIIRTSNEYATSPGYCGSESGIIPGCEYAPHALIREIEVNRIPDTSYTIKERFAVPR